MGEIEERIEQVLNDPAQMERLSSLARSLMGGGGASEPEASPGTGLDAATAAKIGAMLREDTLAEHSREELLRALGPWLAPRRREKLARALRIARLGRIAQRFLGEGEEHV